MYNSPPSPVDEDIGFVKNAAMGYENTHAHRIAPVKVPPGGDFETILPSIEDNFATANIQQAPLYDMTQRENAPQRYKHERQIVQQPAPSLVLGGNEEQPHVKRRRFDDQHWLDENRPSTILVPLNHGVNYSSKHSRPAGSMYAGDTLPLFLDKRIVQLPPRDATRYEDIEGRSKVSSRSKGVEDYPIYRVSREQDQVHRLKPKIPGMPQSPKCFAASYPLHDNESPISSNFSAPLYPEVLDPCPSLHYVPGIAGADGRVSSNLAVAQRPLRQLEEVHSQVQRDFRDLGLDSSPRWNQENGVQVDAQSKSRSYASSHALGLTQLSTVPREATSLGNLEEHQQHPEHQHQLASSTKHPNHSDEVGFGPDDQGIATYARRYSPEIDCNKNRSLGEFSFRALPRGAEWSGLPRITGVANGLLFDQEPSKAIMGNSP